MTAVVGISAAVVLWSRASANESELRAVSAADCSFQVNPEEFLSGHARVREEVFDRAGKLDGYWRRQAGAERTVPASQIPRRNFIDVEIFDRLAAAGVPSAKLSSDEEFFRRIHLDLTGRLPSPDEVRNFLSDQDAGKRSAVIDRLLFSPEFVDRWTMWLGDLLGNSQTASNVNRQMPGRNAFHDWIRGAVAGEKSLKDIAWEAVSTPGNNFDSELGAANFAVSAVTPMGPIQDTYDSMLFRTASTFLGMSHYDCVLCHDGRRRLDEISLWGKEATRVEAQRMAAFFSRMRLTRVGNREDPLYNSYNVVDLPTGNYALNTNFGNRPSRVPVGSERSLNPEYRVTGAKPSGAEWRAAFADNMVQDPMFARNMVNRIWKQLFGLGLVDPVDALDPARLDPENPPQAPWAFQATHPALLEKLAEEFTRGNSNLRETIRLMTSSSAYQLSSRYDDTWKLDYVPLFARHYPRRLEGEEIHDAVAKATGVPGRYTVGGWSEPVVWAIQLPEPVEPRSNGAVNNFMNAFLRGNRDTQTRSQSISIQQQLNLMNDRFVLDRIRMTASPNLRALAGRSDKGELVEELFLLFLSRRPTEFERSRAVAHLDRATTAAQRNTTLEDLAWACINKVDFIFSY